MSTVNLSDFFKNKGFNDYGTAVNAFETKAGRPITQDETVKLANSFSNIKSSYSSSSQSFGNSVSKGIDGFIKTQALPSIGALSLQGEEKLEPGQLASSFKDMVSSGGNFIQKIKSLALTGFDKFLSETNDILGKQVDLRNTINIQLGLSGKLSEDFRDNIFEAYPGVVRMGIGFEDLKRTVVETSQNLGTMAMYSAEVFTKGALVARDFLNSFTELPGLIKNFEEVGIGGSDAMDKITEAGMSSMRLGLQSKKVVTDLNANLSKLNAFGFENGVQGLKRMVQTSIEFKIGMEKTFQMAEKLFSPENAIDLSANLQAIGGAIGQFNDPLRLMYDATNNVGELQDAIIGAAGSLATYNQEQGRFEITGVNLRKSKALAEQFGMSMEELGKVSIKASERASVASSLLSSGLKLDDKEKEFITNISRMEGGKMIIDVSSISKEFGGATKIELDKLTSGQRDALIKNRKYLEEMNPEQVAREQLTQTQNMALDISAIAAYLKVRGGRQLQKVGKGLDNLIISPTEKLIGEKAKDLTKLNITNGYGTTQNNIKPSDLIPITKENINPPNTNLTTNKISNKDITSTNNKVDVTIKTDGVVLDTFRRSILDNPTFAYDMKSVIGEYTNIETTD